jgi:hypothetical protein
MDQANDCIEMEQVGPACFSGAFFQNICASTYLEVDWHAASHHMVLASLLFNSICPDGEVDQAEQ